MAKRHHITHPIWPQGGPVTAAIRAVREPATPWFTPVDPADTAVSGYHIARRHEWADSGRQELVWLEVDELDGEWTWSVWRCGAGKPEDPMEWEFTLRVGGIRSMPAETLDLEATWH